MLIRREPAQNSEQTHESAYVLRDPATLPEAEQVTAQGLTDAVSHARVTVKMRMLLDTGPGQLAAGAAGLEEALADGALDTATGACLDFTHSPFCTPGLCTASFLDCLACSNAVATHRHLPRLAWLHRALDELRATAPPATCSPEIRRVTAGRVAFAAASCVAQIVVVAADRAGVP